MNDVISCWRCGADLDDDLFPLQREEVCGECDADLHVCKLCVFYNPSVADACDEPIAAQVTNKIRANFCDYWKPSPNAYRAKSNDEATKSRAELDLLFGTGSDSTAATDGDAGRAELDQLFGLDDD
ncbi:MAG: hypothetical protein O7G83_18285 [Proteobacteria bacterium]|nr:hypothetical protein [Pseudomonadota bacterium]MCZ6893954.1 hypothetical protein [Gammaproteobacteria bacterium]